MASLKIKQNKAKQKETKKSTTKQTMATSLITLQPCFWFSYILKGYPDRFMWKLRLHWKWRSAPIQHYEIHFFPRDRSIPGAKQNKNTEHTKLFPDHLPGWEVFLSFPLIWGTWSFPERLYCWVIMAFVRRSGTFRDSFLNWCSTLVCFFLTLPYQT